MNLKKLMKISSEMGVQTEIRKLTGGLTGAFIPLERVIDGTARLIPPAESAVLMRYLNRTKAKWNYYGNYSGIAVIIPVGSEKGEPV